MIRCKSISAQGDKLYYTQTNDWQSHVKITRKQNKTWSCTKQNKEPEHIYLDSSYKQSDKGSGECNMEQTEETHSPQEITKLKLTTTDNRLVEKKSDFSRNNNRFGHAYIESTCEKEGEGSGDFNMEQTEETHSPQNTITIHQGEHRQNQAPVSNPYKQTTEIMSTTGHKPKVGTVLMTELQLIKDKFKRNVAEINWYNRALIKEFSTLKPHKLQKNNWHSKHQGD